MPEHKAEHKLPAILLAAGASTRLGQPKQLVQINHESLLRRAVRLATEAGFGPIVVVLGFEAERMRHELHGLHVSVEVNHHWAKGMGSSLCCGMQVLTLLDPGAAGVLMLVCDQMLLSREHLKALLDVHRADRPVVTASAYKDRVGVPAILSAELFPEMLRLEDDHGARELIHRLRTRFPDRIRILPWPQGEADLDSPDDLRLLPAQ